MSKPEEKLRRLIEVLRLVAAPVEVQLRIFPDFVCKGDEIALAFGDNYLNVDVLAESGRINKRMASLLGELDERFSAMSGHENAELWTEEAVMSRKEWQECRQMARQILDVMGIENREPDLDWITFVPGKLSGNSEKESSKFTCPVCGYPGLDEQPRTESDGGSYEICVSCGFQFGVSDEDRHISYEQWRDRWVSEGCPWSVLGIPPPENWDPKSQLRTLNLGEREDKK